MFDSPLFAQRGPVNTARFMFLDPAATDFWVDWDKGANDAVAFLRSETGRSPHDRVLVDLIGELTTRSKEFAVRWGPPRREVPPDRRQAAATPAGR